MPNPSPLQPTQRENKKAKFFGGKGPEAQWLACWSSGLKITSSVAGGVCCFAQPLASASMWFSWSAFFCLSQSHHAWILSGLEAVQACAKKSEPENLFFCKALFHPKRGYSTKREPQRGIATLQFPSHKTHKTSRINCKLKIWQSYPRVPPILKVLCAWYS